MPDSKTHGISGLKVIGIYDVWKHMGQEKITAVSDFNLEVFRGEIVSILGPSGCGKTTTLRLIAGFERPDSGHVVINGQVVAGDDTFVPPERRNVGIVLQEFALFPHLTVRQNIAFGLRGKNRAHNRKRISEMLKLAGLEDLEKRYPSQLSGGQQQRVALARALAPSPSIVLLDEPFASVDPDLRSKMRAELKQILKRTSVTAVFVTHDQEEAFLVADRVAIMNNGRIHQTGTPTDVYHNPSDIFVADFVGHANFIPGRVHSDIVSTGVGELPLGTNLAEEGSEVTVMLRPDDIDIIPTESGIGVITDIEFRGRDTIYHIRLKDADAHIRSLQNSSYMPAVGTNVNLKINSSNIIIFGDSGISARSTAKKQYPQTAAPPDNQNP